MFIAGVGVLAVFSVVVAVLGAYHGHMPFSPARNGFGDELAAIGQPIEDVTLADAPYVTVEPQKDRHGSRSRSTTGSSCSPKAGSTSTPEVIARFASCSIGTPATASR